MYYRRQIESTIEGWVGKGKILVIYDPAKLVKPL